MAERNIKFYLDLAPLFLKLVWVIDEIFLVLSLLLVSEELKSLLELSQRLIILGHKKVNACF